jgi:conjugative transfer pilus assembly protein TraH
METIATKIRTRSALSTEEKQFVANVRTLPVTACSNGACGKA